MVFCPLPLAPPNGSNRRSRFTWNTWKGHLGDGCGIPSSGASHGRKERGRRGETGEQSELCRGWTRSHPDQSRQAPVAGCRVDESRLLAVYSGRGTSDVAAPTRPSAHRRAFSGRCRSPRILPEKCAHTPHWSYLRAARAYGKNAGALSWEEAYIVLASNDAAIEFHLGFPQYHNPQGPITSSISIRDLARGSTKRERLLTALGSCFSA